MRQISVQEALALSKEEAVLVDIRQEEEFSRGSIPGAVNIPAEELEDHAELWQQDKTVYLFCHTGRKSAECGRGIPLVSEVVFESVYETGRKPRRTHGTD